MKNTVHIGWYSMHEFLHYYADLSNYLISKDCNKYRFSHVVHSGHEKKTLTEKYNFKHPTYNLNSYLRKNWNSFDTSTEILSQLELKYGFPSLSPLILSVYFIHRLDYQKIIKLLVGHIRFFEEYFEQSKPDYFVSERCNMLSTHVAWAVCQKYDVIFLCFVKFPIENSFQISSNRMGFSSHLNDEYARLKERDLSVDEDLMATEFIKSFCQNPKKTSDIIIKSKKPQISWTLKKLIKWLPKAVTYYIDRPYYMFRHPAYYQMELLVRIVRSKAYSVLNLFESADYGKKYVLYPLHRIIEYSLHVSAPFTYADQISLIKTLALSIPLDHELYVKEHTGFSGGRQISFYKKIKKIPRVRLISSYEDTFRLIRKSSAIIVLSGTMGWEGILFKKPVITLGYTWYDFYDGLFKGGDPKELTTIINDAIKSNQPNEINIKKAVVAVLNVKKDGYVLLNELERLHRPENIKALGDALIEKITNDGE